MKRALTFLPSSLMLDGGILSRLTTGAELFNTSCPVVKVTFTLQSVIGVTPRVYQYKIEAVDGRIWKQTITFDSNNPQMTFNMTDSWRFSEFSQQRDLRDCLVACAKQHPTLEKITYDFT